MQTTTVAVIGAGQAGLAMSHCLGELAIDHLLLERREVANSWRTERWDSLRLLTPNWLTRLPGWQYVGSDPHGYMTAAEVVAFLDIYRRAIDAPVQTNTTVRSVAPATDGFVVTTDQDEIDCRAVVVATGACSTPKIPAVASELPRTIRQLAPIQYRRPDDVGHGRVLVVGASASGAQLADELARSGHDVTLAVGAHTRVPRTYRGRDIHWWMDAVGLLDMLYDDVEDVAKARRYPSLQLIGSSEHRTLDLNSLSAQGVKLVGRLVGIDGGRAQFSGSLAHVCADADLKMGRLLDQIDEFAGLHDLAEAATDRERPPPTMVQSPATTDTLSGCSAVIWATGFKPTYPWLDPACLDRNGAILHDGGIMTRPGMYVLGLPYTRRRKSSFLDGVGADAQFLAAHLAGYLDRTTPRSLQVPDLQHSRTSVA